MAQKAILDIPEDVPSQPSPMDLAREAAQYEEEDFEPTVKTEMPETKQKSSKKTVKTAKTVSVVAFEVPDIQADQRRNATFSISYKMHEQLDAAAAKYNTSRSAILERVFFAWWEQAQSK